MTPNDKQNFDFLTNLKEKKPDMLKQKSIDEVFYCFSYKHLKTDHCWLWLNTTII